jgi:hypothetical protein
MTGDEYARSASDEVRAMVGSRTTAQSRAKEP